MKDNIVRLLEMIAEAVGEINENEAQNLIDLIISAGAVYVYGAGRSGLVGRAFAMRLMHLGKTVYFVGETITPAIGKNDLLIAISGSGKTASVIHVAQAAKRVGARVCAITSYPDSPLGGLADAVVRVPGRTKDGGVRDYMEDQLLGKHVPLAPLGTLFELSTLIFLDSIIVELMRRLEKDERDMRQRHTNLE